MQCHNLMAWGPAHPHRPKLPAWQAGARLWGLGVGLHPEGLPQAGCRWSGAGVHVVVPVVAVCGAPCAPRGRGAPSGHCPASGPGGQSDGRPSTFAGHRLPPCGRPVDGAPLPGTVQPAVLAGNPTGGHQRSRDTVWLRVGATREPRGSQEGATTGGHQRSQDTGCLRVGAPWTGRLFRALSSQRSS